MEREDKVSAAQEAAALRFMRAMRDNNEFGKFLTVARIASALEVPPHDGFKALDRLIDKGLVKGLYSGAEKIYDTAHPSSRAQSAAACRFRTIGTEMAGPAIATASRIRFARVGSRRATASPAPKQAAPASATAA